MAKKTKEDTVLTVEKPIVTKPIEFSELKTFIREQITNQCASFDEIYKNYFMDTSDRAILLKKEQEEWRTNIKTPMTLMFVDKAANVVLKTGGRFVVTDLFSDRRGEDWDTIIQNMLDLVDRTISQDKNATTLTDIIKDMMCIGPGILKTSYNKYSKKASYKDFSGKMKEVTKTYDSVSLDYVSPYHFFPYYHVSNLEDATFIAERMLMPKNLIDRMMKKQGVTVDWKKIEAGYDSVSDVDYVAVKNGIPFYGFNMGEHSDTRIDEHYKIDKTRQLKEVIELHTQTHTWIYIDGHEHGPFESMEQRVLFDYRYRMIHFRKLSGSIKSIGLWHYLLSLQREYDGITNARIDNVLLAVNKMWIASPESNLGANGKKVKMWPGVTIKGMPGDVKPLEMWEIPGSSYRETEGLFNLAQAVSGTTSMQLGLQNKVERVAGSSEMLKEALDDQLIEPIASISKLRAKIFKDIVVLSLAYMSKEQFDKILGSDNKLKDIDIETVINDFEFSFEVDSESVKNSAVTLQLLMNYMSVVAKMVDTKGLPIADVRSVSAKIRESLGLPIDVELSEKDIVSLTGPSEAPQDPNAALTSLQTLGAGASLWALGTNPTGVNT